MFCHLSTPIFNRIIHTEYRNHTACFTIFYWYYRAYPITPTIGYWPRHKTFTVHKWLLGHIVCFGILLPRWGIPVGIRRFRIDHKIKFTVFLCINISESYIGIKVFKLYQTTFKSTIFNFFYVIRSCRKVFQ